ncbi:DsbA family protein [Sphingomonas crusticola]|uniref:DsbA family protein n=1 Tax=Sphingomonas crusticola TaxID=1697973 RepID=UPI000E281593|nr:DsbA family protein [Sphingomonas crusticola]
MSRTVTLPVALVGIALAAIAGLAIGWALPRPGVPSSHVAARDYAVAHPEIIAEAIDRLRIGSDRRAIETPFASAWAGNPRGDVTLVMFSDYNCPYCRASATEIDRLLKEDPKLKVVWREMPVLGPDSDAAALAALAAAKQGKYLAFHRALFAGNHPDRNGIATAARSVGLAATRFAADTRAADVTAELTSNLSLARRMQIAATPFFVIGNRTYQGAIGYDGLVAAIAEARKPAR